MPVRSLDGERVGASGQGPLFLRLRAAFEACKAKLGEPVPA